LLSNERMGLLLPKDALLYGEDGAYVYKQVVPKTPAEKVQYVPVKVTPLVPYGDGWLVKGVDDDDEIVVHGVGVLWSLEGMGAHPVDDDDD
jgi:multidrug efflux pump subunit AcrA (membrane-fusion protein)